MKAFMLSALALVAVAAVVSAGAIYDLKIKMVGPQGPLDTLTINLEPDTTVEEVKEIVKAKTGIVPERQSLFLGATELENEHDLEYYGIDHATPLVLKVDQADIKSTANTGSIYDVKIRMVGPEGDLDTLTINLERDTTVQEVKEIIQAKTGIKPERQSVFLGATELENEHDLEHYEIEHETPLVVKVAKASQ